jgi:hypothetical protein
MLTEYLIVLGLMVWAFGELFVGIILVTVLIAALGAAIWRR